MFDLDRAVASWCRRTYPWPHYSKDQISELEDHLHCAVGKLVAQDCTPREAFERATEQLGEAASLNSEYRKNWSWLTTAIRSIECRQLQVTAAVMVTGIFLGLILLLRDAESQQWTRNMLIAIYTMPFKFFGVAT